MLHEEVEGKQNDVAWRNGLEAMLMKIIWAMMMVDVDPMIVMSWLGSTCCHDAAMPLQSMLSARRLSQNYATR